LGEMRFKGKLEERRGICLEEKKICRWEREWTVTRGLSRVRSAARFAHVDATRRVSTF